MTVHRATQICQILLFLGASQKTIFSVTASNTLILPGHVGSRAAVRRPAGPTGAAGVTAPFKLTGPPGRAEARPGGGPNERGHSDRPGNRFIPDLVTVISDGSRWRQAGGSGGSPQGLPGGSGPAAPPVTVTRRSAGHFSAAYN